MKVVGDKDKMKKWLRVNRKGRSWTRGHFESTAHSLSFKIVLYQPQKQEEIKSLVEKSYFP